MGGATLAHWSGEKEACISPDPDIRTRGTAIFSKTKSFESDSAAPLDVVLQQEEEEVVSRRWSAGGERWRRYDAGEGVRWRRCCDAGEGVMWRLMRCGWRGGVVVEW